MYGLNDTRQTAEDGLFLKQDIGKNCELSGIPDAGHFSHMDQPGKVSGGFFSFIKKTDNNKKW
jgi:pimeloyl-ACP methyl ester carboxylesterase